MSHAQLLQQAHVGFQCDLAGVSSGMLLEIFRRLTNETAGWIRP